MDQGVAKGLSRSIGRGFLAGGLGAAVSGTVDAVRGGWRPLPLEPATLRDGAGEAAFSDTSGATSKPGLAELTGRAGSGRGANEAVDKPAAPTVFADGGADQ